MNYSRPTQDPHRTELIIEKSRFITSVCCAIDVASARAFLHQISMEMVHASHHVYAYRIGYGNSVIDGMSDAGEPTGTAGPPTFAVIKGSGLGDIVLVTTRYFGGIKLGTGGLVRAYTESAQQALKTLTTELNIAKKRFSIDLPYSYYEIIKRLLAEYEGVILQEDFGSEVIWILEIPDPKVLGFTTTLRDITRGAVIVKEL